MKIFVDNKSVAQSSKSRSFAIRNYFDSLAADFSIMRIVLTVHGRVKTLRPDNGKSFTEGPFQVWCKKVGIDIVPTSLYNPRANRAKRHHRDINRMLDLSYSTAGTIEDDMFQFCQSHNLLKKRSTGYAPFELLKGHLPAELVDDLYDGAELAQLSFPARKMIEEAWESRNVKNLAKTLPSQEAVDALVDKNLIWDLGVNNKKPVFEVVANRRPAAARVR